MKRTINMLCVLIVSISPSVAAQEDEGAHEGSNYTSRVVRVRQMGLGNGYLGVQLTPLTPELRVHFGVPEDTGILVARVEEGGPAEAAGILVGDIMSAINGERIDDVRGLMRAVRQQKEGDTATVELYRDGAMHNYPVTISERERSVVSLTGGYRFMPEGGELTDHRVVIEAPSFRLDDDSMIAFDHAMRDLEEHFDSAEWQEKLERVKELDFSTIQERMREVERRLKELEEELERENEQPEL